MFAWHTFIALNWPAIDPDKHDNVRGFPDTDQSFINAKPEALTVWETFKEKREVFNRGTIQHGHYVPGDPGPWNGPVNYGPLRPANEDTSHVVTVSANDSRVFHAASKIVANYFDTFDETVEVLAEALEPQIDSLVYGGPVAPRVWLGQPSDNVPVLYEVKVNYDFYKYVRTHKLFNDSIADTLAKQGKIRLPYRTSSKKGPNKKQIIANKFSYRVDSTLHVYKKATHLAKVDSLTKASQPPQLGSIHVKAAWIKLSDKSIEQLTPQERQKLKIDTYHVANGVYYVTKNGKPMPQPGTFGLVGLHIIQRVHFGFGERAQPYGGTFVFATWEHVGNDTAGFTYSNFYDSGRDARSGLGSKPETGWYPHASGKHKYPKGWPVQRRPGAVLKRTKKINSLVHEAIKIKAGNSKSVWLNYRLIGTQFVPVDLSGQDYAFVPPDTITAYDPTNVGQNAYLANLVIETNYGLQNFQGIPPAITVIGNFKKVKSNSSPYFIRTNPDTTSPLQNNLQFNQKGYNMGGCMGCHGVAQIQGYSFSFVLLGGSDGAKTDTEMLFDLPISDVENKGN